MSRKRLLLLASCLLLLLALASPPGVAWGQKTDSGQKVLRKQNIKLTKANTTPVFFSDYRFEFPNVNEVPYYHDEDELKEINKYWKKKKFEQALPRMEDYILNFGIQNFYRDTDRLWKLAQLYERMGKMDKAKGMYRLVLKHHRQAMEKVRLHYESLMKNEKDYFIPLDFYYELVEYRKTIDTLHPPHSVLTDMGNSINSQFSDYGPSLSQNSDSIIFTSDRIQKGPKGELLPPSTQNENLYLSRGYQGYWEHAEPIEELNTRYNEGSAFISQDGHELYFTRCQAPDGYGNCDIYRSTLNEDGSWTSPQNLGPNVNGKSWDSQPSLSHTGDTLFFASDRLGGFGLSDIYFSVRQPGGGWSEARNLGPTVNTRGSEVSPYFHPKYNILYFSSTGHLVNFGNFDIYKSYLYRGKWTEPNNIGPLVNGEGSEYYFTIDSESEKLYYARTENQVKDTLDLSNLDLYSFPLPMGAQPLATTRFHGKLTDSAGNTYEGIVSIIDLDEGVEVAPKGLRPDGTFDFDLINDRDYMLVIQGEDFFRIEEVFHLTGDTTFHKKVKSIQSRKITLPKVDFSSGSAEITDRAKEELVHVKDFLIDNPHYRLKISGHTDSRGNKKKNLRLSKERAHAIKDWLVKDGAIEPERIDAEGYGNTKPIIKNAETDAEHSKNRRVEFELIKPVEQFGPEDKYGREPGEEPEGN